MNEPQINLQLDLQEVNGILHALGELPAKTNAMALIQKIQAQAEPQLPKEEQSKKQLPQEDVEKIKEI